MESTIKDKVVFVTGGANGIGRAIVSRFCDAGADVTFCDTDESAARQLCSNMSKYQCAFVKADVLDADSLTRALDTVIAEKGNIDIIINNVGVGLFRSILEVSVEDFEKVLDINLRTVFVTAKVFAAHRVSNPHFNTYGRIINMASTRYLMSEPDSEAYAASKGAIVSLTHALAMSLAKYNITVNCISPGWIETGDYNMLKSSDHLQHPLGRVGVPDDIARTCLFLCDPANNFINGQNIVVDGGMTKKMIYEE